MSYKETSGSALEKVIKNFVLFIAGKAKIVTNKISILSKNTIPKEINSQK